MFRERVARARTHSLPILRRVKLVVIDSDQ
jgi:hypothetical protein